MANAQGAPTMRTRRSLSNNLKNLEGDIEALLQNFDQLHFEELTGLTNLLIEKTARFV